MKKKILIGLGTLVLLGGGILAYALQAGWFDRTVHDVYVGASQTSETINGSLDEALTLAKKAHAKLQKMAGYHCIYLRDERIENELQQNSLKLTVHHEPFGVLMEWVEPKAKMGRKASYVSGKNNDKMRVKIGIATLSFDLKQSIAMKESRHTLNEAGLKNMMERFVKAWEEEKLAGETNTQYSNFTVEATVSGKQYKYDCRLVETDHPVATKNKYLFYRTRIYFDMVTGLPVRMEGYDWPTSADKAGRLLERYSYFDVKDDPPPKLSQVEM